MAADSVRRFGGGVNLILRHAPEAYMPVRLACWLAGGSNRAKSLFLGIDTRFLAFSWVWRTFPMDRRAIPMGRNAPPMDRCGLPMGRRAILMTRNRPPMPPSVGKFLTLGAL